MSKVLNFLALEQEDSSAFSLEQHSPEQTFKLAVFGI
jgi:hypothetical protein